MAIATAPEALARETLLDFERFAPAFLQIRTKDRRLIAFHLNAVQRAYRRRVQELGSRRNLILKARQFGFTTLIQGEQFHAVVTTHNTMALTVAHRDDSSELIFQMVRLFYDRMPEPRPQTRYANRRELSFPRLNSWYTVQTAGGGEATGRSLTVNYLHCSEVAFWEEPDRAMPGLLEAVPKDGVVTLESTPNMLGDYWHQQYEAAKRGESNFRAHFFPWFIHPEYSLPLDQDEAIEWTAEERELAEYALREHGTTLTPEQIKWRRAKRLDLLDRFPAEYPENDVDCFMAAGRPRFNRPILRRMLDQAKAPSFETPFGLQVWKGPIPGKHYVIGADPAEGTEQGDYSAAQVIRWDNNEQVAKLHGKWAPIEFADRLVQAGRLYHHALVAVERNNHGHAVLQALVQGYRYPSIYAHAEWDAREGEVQRFGWLSTVATKPVAVSLLDQAINTYDIQVYDRDTLMELIAYVYNARGDTEAPTGLHDDLVSALYVAQVARANWTPPVALGANVRRPPDPWATVR